MKRKTGKYITQNNRAISTCGNIKHKIPDYIAHKNILNTKYQSAFHMPKNRTQNTRARSTRRKIHYKISDRVPHAKKYNTK